MIYQGKIVFVLPRKVCILRKQYEVAKGLIAQHERRATLWKDACRSLVTRYDSDVSEFGSEQRNSGVEHENCDTL